MDRDINWIREESLKKIALRKKVKIVSALLTGVLLLVCVALSQYAEQRADPVKDAEQRVVSALKKARGEKEALNVQAIVMGVFLALFGGMSIFTVSLFMMDFDKKIIKLPGLLCPWCKKHIDGDSGWTCPYCDTSYYYNRSIYEPCKKCGRQADLIECPWCDKNFLVGNKANDGMALKINKGLKRSIEQIFQTAQEENIGPEEIGEGIKKIKDFIAVVKGQDKDDIDIMRLKKEHEKLIEHEKIKRIKGQERADDSIEGLRKKMEREAKERAIKLFGQFETRSAIEKEYEMRREEILKGRRLSDLVKEELGALEDLDDAKRYAFDRL
jgi:hypothetical protein